MLSIWFVVKFRKVLRFWGYTSQPVYDPLHKPRKEVDVISELVDSFSIIFRVIQRIHSFLHILPKWKYSCFFAVYSVCSFLFRSSADKIGESSARIRVIQRIHSFLHTLPSWKYSCFFAVYSVSSLSCRGCLLLFYVLSWWSSGVVPASPSMVSFKKSTKKKEMFIRGR